jgi:hypothetical protein
MRGIGWLGVAAATAALWAGTEEPSVNPLRNAKVGDWAIYAMVTEVTGAMNMQSLTKTKHTLKAKDEKEARLTVETILDKDPIHILEQKYDLGKPYDPNPPRAGAKVEDLGSGEETVRIGEKSYKCRWVKRKSSLGEGAGATVVTVKLWTSAEAPLTGVVRGETESETALGDQALKTSVRFSLTESGSAK